MVTAGDEPSGYEVDPGVEDWVRLRIHGSAARPVVVYLPGLHGDWTLIGAFRHALGDSVRFVEVVYPRTLTWSLGDYADRLEVALGEAALDRGWILAESFGSQVAWAFCGSPRRFEIQGLVLAGGFGRHPTPILASFAKWVLASFPKFWLRIALQGYAGLSRWRFRAAPQARSDLEEFIRRRTRADREAMLHRLQLIAENEPSALAQKVRVPVHYLTGFWDPIVPWPLVRRWLQSRCPAFRGWRCVLRGDHNVLSSSPKTAASIVRHWIGVNPVP
ncbi:MAG: alpha/beta hydrolase [Verrucomicrobiales bacterium]|nr:alpha/beta hydrolase [Verrucomicrobiales bacterium]